PVEGEPPEPPAAATIPSSIATDTANAASTVKPVAPEFQAALPELKQKTTVPVLLPSALPTSVLAVEVYLSVRAEPDSYAVNLDLAPECYGATACAFGGITAQRNETLYTEEFTETVLLATGITGHYKPITCGASCSPPAISWQYQDVLYRIDFEVADDSKGKAQLMAIANSAIEAGPR
ncbi:MAG: hypothetical protein F6K19_50120, partial [Cyanothece sp. SIO1E1]|nr:hypothetical protein [Cyanothece sp. SIO1E1]